MTFTFGKIEFRFNWKIAACVLLTAAGLIRLGLWQLDRAGEKFAQQRSFQDAGLQQASPLPGIPLAGRELDMLQHQNRRVSLSGHYLNEQSVFLIYQTFQDQLGYEVVTPFRLADMDQIVLVSRGWSRFRGFSWEWPEL